MHLVVRSPLYRGLDLRFVDYIFINVYIPVALRVRKRTFTHRITESGAHLNKVCVMNPDALELRI